MKHWNELAELPAKLQHGKYWMLLKECEYYQKWIFHTQRPGTTLILTIPLLDGEVDLKCKFQLLLTTGISQFYSSYDPQDYANKTFKAFGHWIKANIEFINIVE